MNNTKNPKLYSKINRKERIGKHTDVHQFGLLLFEMYLGKFTHINDLSSTLLVCNNIIFPSNSIILELISSSTEEDYKKRPSFASILDQLNSVLDHFDGENQLHQLISNTMFSRKRNTFSDDGHLDEFLLQEGPNIKNTKIN